LARALPYWKAEKRFKNCFSATRRRKKAMKKFFGLILSLILLAGLSVSTASAQHNYGRYNRSPIGTLGKVGIGTAAGTIIGGIIGGKRGAVVGGIAGAGGGYIWSRRNRYYYPRGYYNNYPSYNNYPYYGVRPSRH
jgi:hypothetical protein